MSLKISRILHAGYVFESGNTQIAFDPIFENPFSRNCYAFPAVQFNLDEIKKLKWDAVFISHFHDDHCSLTSLNLLDKKTPIYIYCLHEELLHMIRELGFEKVESLEINIQVQIGEIKVIPKRALDEEVDSLFHIKVDGLNILNVVDSLIDDSTISELAQTPNWDMVLWPFQTMLETDVLSPSRVKREKHQTPPEFIEQLRILNPRYIVPSSCQFEQESWSWYNQALFPISYLQFQNEMKEHLPESHVIRMNPSVSVVLDKTTIQQSASLGWVLPIGDQNVDYKYNLDPQWKVPSTSEIACHFPPLSPLQTEKVLSFCKHGLIEKYNSLGGSEDLYFRKLRIWRLSLFDHQGKPSIFYYQLSRKTIELIPEGEYLLGWTTEVPLFKLFGALDSGESLTSMYVRINDVLFDEKIEKEIESVDLLEDPLIQSLFTGSFGAYQREQLRLIKS